MTDHELHDISLGCRSARWSSYRARDRRLKAYRTMQEIGCATCSAPCNAAHSCIFPILAAFARHEESRRLAGVIRVRITASGARTLNFWLSTPHIKRCCHKQIELCAKSYHHAALHQLRSTTRSGSLGDCQNHPLPAGMENPCRAFSNSRSASSRFMP